MKKMEIEELGKAFEESMQTQTPVILTQDKKSKMVLFPVDDSITDAEIDMVVAAIERAKRATELRKEGYIYL